MGRWIVTDVVYAVEGEDACNTHLFCAFETRRGTDCEAFASQVL